MRRSGTRTSKSVDPSAKRFRTTSAGNVFQPLAVSTRTACALPDELFDDSYIAYASHVKDTRDRATLSADVGQT